MPLRKDLDIHIETQNARVTFDARNKITWAPAVITMTPEELIPLLKSQAPQGHTPAELMARLEAERVQLGKRITYNGVGDSVTYEITDFDALHVQLRQLTKTELK